jgi:hypothetical protein
MTEEVKGERRAKDTAQHQAARSVMTEEVKGERRAQDTAQHQAARSVMTKEAKQERRAKAKERHDRTATTIAEKESYVYEGGDPPEEVLEWHEHNVHSALLRFCNGTGRTTVNDSSLDAYEQMKGKYATSGHVNNRSSYILFCIVSTFIGAVSLEDLKRCVNNFNAAMNPNCCIRGCAVCGERIIEMDIAKCRQPEVIDSRFDMLLLDDAERAEYLSESNLEHRLVRNIYQLRPSLLYKLAHELVTRVDDETSTCFVCDTCKKALFSTSPQLPRYAIANNFDYGNWRHVSELTELTLAESILVSRVFTHYHIIKLVIKGNTVSPAGDKTGQLALKGHIIAFEHEKRHVLRATKDLPVRDPDDIISVVLVGSKEHVNELVGANGKDPKRIAFLQRPDIQKVLSVRAGVVENTLRFLKKFNPMYADLEIPSFTEKKNGRSSINEDLDKLPYDILDKALYVYNKDDIQRENEVGSNIARFGEDFGPTVGGFSAVYVGAPPSRDVRADDLTKLRRLSTLVNEARPTAFAPSSMGQNNPEGGPPLHHQHHHYDAEEMADGGVSLGTSDTHSSAEGGEVPLQQHHDDGSEAMDVVEEDSIVDSFIAHSSSDESESIHYEYDPDEMDVEEGGWSLPGSASQRYSSDSMDVDDQNVGGEAVDMAVESSSDEGHHPEQQEGPMPSTATSLQSLAAAATNAPMFHTPSPPAASSAAPTGALDHFHVRGRRYVVRGTSRPPPLPPRGHEQEEAAASSSSFFSQASLPTSLPSSTAAAPLPTVIPSLPTFATTAVALYPTMDPHQPEYMHQQSQITAEQPESSADDAALPTSPVASSAASVTSASQAGVAPPPPPPPLVAAATIPAAAGVASTAAAPVVVDEPIILPASAAATAPGQQPGPPATAPAQPPSAHQLPSSYPIGRLKVVEAPVDLTAMNEFTNNDQILYGRFVMQFLLGQGLATSGTVSDADIQHMLNYYDQRFSECIDFIFYLFNQKQRHAAVRGVSARVKSGERHMQEFEELVNHPDFAQRLANAEINPQSDDAKMLMTVLNRLLNIAGTSVPWSGVERRQTLSKLYSLVNYAGPYMYFVTISPSDAESAFVIRFSQRVGETKSDGSGGNGNEEGDEEDIEIKVPYLFYDTVDQNFSPILRQEMLAGNPVAQAEYYKLLMENITTYLFGLPPSHCTKQSLPIMQQRVVGILGKLIAYIKVTEAQGRGSPHGHCLIITDVSPYMLRRVAADPDLINGLMQRIDSTIKAYWSNEVHETDTAAKEPTKTLIQMSCELCPQPGTEEFDERYCNVMKRCNVHRHMATCHKGKTGEYQCRMGYPIHTFNGETQLRELVVVEKGYDDVMAVAPSSTSSTAVPPSVAPAHDNSSDNAGASTALPDIELQQLRQVINELTKVVDELLAMQSEDMDVICSPIDGHMERVGRQPDDAAMMDVAGENDERKQDGNDADERHNVSSAAEEHQQHQPEQKSDRWAQNAAAVVQDAKERVASYITRALRR